MTTFTWVGIKEPEVIFLNDHDMTFYCFSRSKWLRCSPLKSNYVQVIVFKKDVSISCTEKYDLVYVFRGVVDWRETEMMHNLTAFR